MMMANLGPKGPPSLIILQAKRPAVVSQRHDASARRSVATATHCNASGESKTGGQFTTPALCSGLRPSALCELSEMSHLCPPGPPASTRSAHSPITIRPANSYPSPAGVGSAKTSAGTAVTAMTNAKTPIKASLPDTFRFDTIARTVVLKTAKFALIM